MTLFRSVQTSCTVILYDLHFHWTSYVCFVDHFNFDSLHCYFPVIQCVACPFHFVPSYFHSNSIENPPSWVPLVLPMECVDLVVFRLTMAFVQTPRPILDISAECTCCLLIYILVNVAPVDFWHPTSSNEVFKFTKSVNMVTKHLTNMHNCPRTEDISLLTTDRLTS